ncbi:ABC transporter ATP-binding protein [Roseateles sp. SL47]|uniref:ABC transporter ATP-binding protein n=1 Tax=Roseateles sp. SL47 TaxID=2995138 RepID=UPI0022709E5B|nr:ABC transporter ATP-binding protein [Roseateles sp. SL47]WAC71561.1 ABC transporter ATP-binding protein [Roseateles sp. SL47]
MMHPIPSIRPVAAALPTAPPRPILSLHEVSKRYPTGTLAVDQVTLSIAPGEVHAIVGENGAGKSTVMKMLYGLEQPSAGEIRLDGQQVHWPSPRAAIAAGMGLVPQHVTLVDSFTVAANVVLGQEPRRGLWLDTRAAARQVAETARRYQLPLDPDAPVSSLSLGEQQAVGLLKALHQGARILMLDEPTAVLPPQQAEALMQALRGFADSGLTVVLITHRIAEIREVADRFTVLRAGRVAGSAASREVSADEITTLVMGRAMTPLKASRRAPTSPTPVLRVRDLSVHPRGSRQSVEGLTLDIAGGEILGVVGVEGNGQTLLADMLAGLLRPDHGEVRVDGTLLHGQGDAGIRAARAAGVAAIPEDRLHDGVAPDMSITENAIANRHDCPPLARPTGWMDLALAGEQTRRLLRDFGVVAASADAAIRSLSGGNMQKVVLAREIALAPRLLVACQPTRGVDIGAAQSLHERLLALRDGGAAILLVSADLDELLALSDRLIVLDQGRLVGHFAAQAVDARRLGLYMTGLRRDPHARADLGAPFTRDEDAAV